MYIKKQQQQQNKQELDPEVGKHFLKRPDSNVSACGHMISMAKMQWYHCRAKSIHRQYINERAWLFPIKLYKNRRSVGEA